MSCHSLLAYRDTVEKSADSLMGVPLYVICHVSLVSFNILSLTCIILITVSLGVLLLGFILPGTLCFLDLVECVLSHVREVFSFISSNIFSGPFFFLFLGPL